MLKIRLREVRLKSKGYFDTAYCVVMGTSLAALNLRGGGAVYLGKFLTPFICITVTHLFLFRV